MRKRATPENEREIVSGYKGMAAVLDISERQFRRERKQGRYPIRFLPGSNIPFMFLDELRIHLKRKSNAVRRRLPH
jgi:preprotein translocase subunit SecY